MFHENLTSALLPDDNHFSITQMLLLWKDDPIYFYTGVGMTESDISKMTYLRIVEHMLIFTKI